MQTSRPRRQSNNLEQSLEKSALLMARLISSKGSDALRQLSIYKEVCETFARSGAPIVSPERDCMHLFCDILDRDLPQTGGKRRVGAFRQYGNTHSTGH